MAAAGSEMEKEESVEPAKAATATAAAAAVPNTDTDAIWKGLVAEFPGKPEDNKEEWKGNYRQWCVRNIAYVMWYLPHADKEKTRLVGEVSVYAIRKGNTMFHDSVREVDLTGKFVQIRRFLAHARMLYDHRKELETKYWTNRTDAAKRVTAVEAIDARAFPISDTKPLTESMTRNMLKYMWYRMQKMQTVYSSRDQSETDAMYELSRCFDLAPNCTKTTDKEAVEFGLGFLSRNYH